MDRLLLAGIASILALVVAAFDGGPAGHSNGQPLFVPAESEGCAESTVAPGATPGSPAGCEGGGSGPGSTGVGGLLSSVATIAVIVIGGLGLVIAFTLVVLARRPPAPAVPAEGWWTCAQCGKGNLVDAPRCFNCGAWRTTETPAPLIREAGE